MSKTVVGVFETQDHAEMAARRIKEQGLRTDDISIVAKPGDTGDPYDAGSAGSMRNADPEMRNSVTGGHANATDNISDGVISGGLLGGLAGLLIGAGSLIVPGFGIIAAAGPITGLLSGAVTGGIVGGLIDLGIPEKESRQYATDIKHGKILFSMKTDDDNVNRVTEVLRNSGATNVQVY